MGYKRPYYHRKSKLKASDGKAADKKVSLNEAHLSDNQLKILELVKARGYVHIPSIRTCLGGSHSDESIKRMIGDLVSLKLVKAELVTARRQTEYLVYDGKRLPYTQISHALLASEAIDRILSNPQIVILTYRSEKELRSEYSKATYHRPIDKDIDLPDSELVFSNPSGIQQGFLEYDSVNYTGARLKTKITNISRYIGASTLYWICYSSRRLNTVKAATEGYSNIRPIMFNGLSSL